jgi:hypothetical protein
MLACGVAILFCARGREDTISLVNGPKVVIGVPMALSCDNLLLTGISSALVSGNDQKHSNLGGPKLLNEGVA